MGDGRESGRDQALRWVQAMDRLADPEGRRACWRAAMKMRNKDRGAAGEIAAPLPRLGRGTPCAGGE